MNAFSQLKPAHQLALLGIVSGVLTTLVRSESFVVKDTSLLPGIFFGLVIAFGLYRWQTKQPLHLIGVFLGVIVAWVAAWNSAFLLHDDFEKMFGKIETWVLLGLVGGFVGSAITGGAVYLFSPAFRIRANWLRVILFGTVAGVLLALPESGLGNGTAALLPLFVVWQAGVAYLIAGGITGLR